jgi:hypothetical protein
VNLCRMPIFLSLKLQFFLSFEKTWHLDLKLISRD